MGKYLHFFSKKKPKHKLYSQKEVMIDCGLVRMLNGEKLVVKYSERRKEYHSQLKWLNKRPYKIKTIGDRA